MAEKKSIVIYGATFCAALSTGYIMQFGFALPSKGHIGSPAAVTVSAIEDTAAIAELPAPETASALPPLPEAALDTIQTKTPAETPVEIAAVDDSVIPMPAPALEQPVAGPACDITLTAMESAGAMVDLQINAPCHGSDRFTLHHNGLMITDVTKPDGTAALKVPALSETAVFIASFDDGNGGLVQANVSSLPFYDRVVVQWRGDAGLQLHAREFGADYFTDGHIWHDARGDITRAAQGQGGFLTRLGNSDMPEALLAEVYSFPAGTTGRSGDVAMSVEAEVTAANCDTDVEAQTLDMRAGGALKVQDLTLAMPACASVGDFLILKNLIEDLKIASN